MLGALAPPALAGVAAPSRANDVRVLSVALWVERLQLELYDQAVRSGGLGAGLLGFAGAAAEHEREHVAALLGLLGPAAGDPPLVDLRYEATHDEAFAAAALRLENLSVLALNGMTDRLTARALSQTARIASVDARHAAWLRGLLDVIPPVRVRDTGWTADQVGEALARDGLAPASPT